MAALPPYVQYGALVGMPPVVGTGGTVYGFFLKANKAKVTALCHKVFAKCSRFPRRTASASLRSPAHPSPITILLAPFVT